MYSIIKIISSVIPSNLIWAATELGIFGVIWTILTILIIVSLITLLIYKSDLIINWLKLEKGFDDDRIDFENFNMENMLKLAVIIIGGILIVENIPSFFSHCLFAFKSSMHSADNMSDALDTKDLINWLASFLNLTIGYLILTNHNYVSQFLQRINNKNDK